MMCMVLPRLHCQRLARVPFPGWWFIAQHSNRTSGWAWSQRGSNVAQRGSNVAHREGNVGLRVEGHTISLPRRGRAAAHAMAPPFHQLVAPSTKTITIASLTTVLQMTL
jgi:hypothetical protein